MKTSHLSPVIPLVLSERSGDPELVEGSAVEGSEPAGRVEGSACQSRRFLAAALLLSVLLLPACDSFEKNAYRSLKVAKVEYELLQEHAARAYLDGRLTDQQWNRFAIAGHRFIAAHTLAADLMKTYQQTRRARLSRARSAREQLSGDEKDDRLRQIQRQVAAALTQLPLLLDDLRALLAAFDSPPADAP